MSRVGLKQWSRKHRLYTRKIVFKPVERIDVHVSQLATAEAIKALCEDRYGVGTWIIRGFSGAKTSKRIKQVRLAKVIVVRAGDHYNSAISDTGRLSRYWFWRGRNG